MDILHLLLSAAMLCSLTAPVANALQCVHCKDCRNQAEVFSTCRPGFDVCMKRVLYNKVEKACAPSVVCKPEEIDRHSPSLIQRLKTLFSARDINRLIRGSNYSRSKSHYCCDTDFCNGSPGLSTSKTLLFLMPLILYVFRV